MNTDVKWVDASKEKPDSDTTVMIHCPVGDDPVWMGYHDGETWRTIDDEPIDEKLVDHWAHLPEPPRNHESTITHATGGTHAPPN